MNPILSTEDVVRLSPTFSSTPSSATQVHRLLAPEPTAPLIPAALPRAGEIGLDTCGWGSVVWVSCGRRYLVIDGLFVLQAWRTRACC
jgi:hypothetical protein